MASEASAIRSRVLATAMAGGPMWLMICEMESMRSVPQGEGDVDDLEDRERHALEGGGLVFPALHNRERGGHEGLLALEHLNAAHAAVELDHQLEHYLRLLAGGARALRVLG